MLEYLNVRPRLSYQAVLRNPNPKMPGADLVGKTLLGNPTNVPSEELTRNTRMAPGPTREPLRARDHQRHPQSVKRTALFPMAIAATPLHPGDHLPDAARSGGD